MATSRHGCGPSLLTPDEQAQVGRVGGWLSSAEPVTRSEIRRLATATLNQNPVHFDDKAARNSRWGGIIAPPTFVIRPPYGGDWIGDPADRIIGPIRIAAAPRAVNAGNETEIFRPVRVGDEVRQRTRLADLEEKSGRAGPMVLVTLETVYADRADRVLALSRQSVIRLPRAEQRLGPADSPIPKSSVQDIDDRPPREYSGLALVYEDAEPGRELPANRYGVINSEMVVRFTAAVENWEALHHDFLWCREHGFPNVLINGPLRLGLLATYLDQLAGDTGILRRVKMSQRNMDVPGNSLTAKAVVTRKGVSHEGYGVVELDAWVENETGARNAPGSATIYLPRRSGPAIPTSFECPRERVAWAFDEMPQESSAVVSP